MLVDTNALLFALLAPERLSPRAHAVLSDGNATLYWSAASTWEVVVKARLGKLDLGGEAAPILADALLAFGMRVLPVTHAHALRVGALHEPAAGEAAPRRHADPFDRLLVAQALVEGLPILTADPSFDHYPVTRVW